HDRLQTLHRQPDANHLNKSITKRVAAPLAWLAASACPLVTGATATAQTLIDTLRAQAIQNETQAQQAGGRGAAGQAAGAAETDANANAANPQAPGAAQALGGAGSSPVFLVSPWKPILVFLVLLGWAWIASFLDKDAAYYYLHRYWWNLGQMACAIL